MLRLSSQRSLVLFPFLCRKRMWGDFRRAMGRIVYEGWVKGGELTGGQWKELHA
jgi:hypothetical protein